MYVITKSQWDRIGDDFKTEHSTTNGGRACFERCINPAADGGTVLIFEYQHFVVIPDEWQDHKDQSPDDYAAIEARNLLRHLMSIDAAARDEWRRRCMDQFKDDAAMKLYISLEYATAEKYSQQTGKSN